LTQSYSELGEAIVSGLIVQHTSHGATSAIALTYCNSLIAHLMSLQFSLLFLQIRSLFHQVHGLGYPFLFIARSIDHLASISIRPSMPLRQEILSHTWLFLLKFTRFLRVAWLSFQKNGFP
jgi:hypothetical protein